MGPQRFRCGNRQPAACMSLLQSAISMGPQRFRCGNQAVSSAVVVDQTISMGPQRFRCGNSITMMKFVSRCTLPYSFFTYAFASQTSSSPADIYCLSLHKANASALACQLHINCSRMQFSAAAAILLLH